LADTRRAAATFLAIGLALCGWARPLSAEHAQQIFIAASPVIYAAPASETPLAIQVGPPDALPKNSFIRIRGLPALATLTGGYLVSPGTWSVPLLAAPDLKISLPGAVQGQSNVAISLLQVDGGVLAKTRMKLDVETLVPGPRAQLAAFMVSIEDPSPLASSRKAFDEFLARRSGGAKGALTPEQKSQMFTQFLTWPQNPVELIVTMRFTSANGLGETIGTLPVKNAEIMVAGHKETALLIRPNLQSLRPGAYAFHIHENASCGPAVKNGEWVPGLAAGSHLWLSGTGDFSGQTFTSHLGNLPNLVVDANGTAIRPIVAARMTLADVANRSFMIHSSQDDNSPRLGCGPLN
jgi:Cu-Zn family superoxide dismutase